MENDYTKIRSCKTPRRRCLVLSSAIVMLLLLAALFTGVFIPLNSKREETLPTVSYPNKTHTSKSYDCVNRSIAKVILDSADYKLIDLDLPNKQPTMNISNFEYLFVPNKATWWMAQKYCIAWCGHLVAMNTGSENVKIQGRLYRFPSL